MIDPRLSWFAIGATCSAVLFGWPWHSRFSRYSKRKPLAKETIYGWGPHQLAPPPPAPGMFRCYFWSPSTMAECGGPCYEAQDPSVCTCGQLWSDVPLPPEKDFSFSVPWNEGRTHRGSNPPAPGCKPAPPTRPATHGWQPNQQEIDKLATQLEEDGKYLIAAGYANESVKTRDLGIRVIRAATLLAGGWNEGTVQRGNGHGGPSTPKPPIKPKPSGGHILKPWE